MMVCSLCRQDDPRILVGIATFDSTVHFYNLNKNLQTVRACMCFLIVFICRVGLQYMKYGSIVKFWQYFKYLDE